MIINNLKLIIPLLTSCIRTRYNNLELINVFGMRCNGLGRIQNSATAGFKYFDCKGVTEFRLTTRGYADGIFEVRTAWDGEVLAEIKIEYTNVWETYSVPIAIPDGVHAIYMTYKGNGVTALKSFELI